MTAGVVVITAFEILNRLPYAVFVPEGLADISPTFQKGRVLRPLTSDLCPLSPNRPRRRRRPRLPAVVFQRRRLIASP